MKRPEPATGHGVSYGEGHETPELEREDVL